MREIRSFITLGRVLDRLIDDVKDETVKTVFDELVFPDTTPRDTGTLVWSWRAKQTPGSSVPIVKQYSGWPEPLDKAQITPKGWTTYFVYNNQPYLNKINDMYKYNEFVQAATRRAVDQMKSYTPHA